MSGRILVVDDIDANVRLLKAKLEVEYFDVITADNGPDAIALARKAIPDLILLDVMMPGMDGYEVCRKLKDDPRTRHIPVVMVTALDQQENRVEGLQSGADDFLAKPIDDVALFARVRSLLRLKIVMDELRQREASGRALGAINDLLPDAAQEDTPARIMILEDDEHQGQRLSEKLGGDYIHVLTCDPREASERLRTERFDLFIVNLAARGFDGLRLCARIRSDEKGRLMPILALVNGDNRERTVRALDIGVNDILPRPVDKNELVARVHTQLKQKKYVDTLRQSLDASFEMSITDQLTGLHNRRFMKARLDDALARAARGIEPASVMIADVDFFKPVNDTYGHDAGDRVLQELAVRLKANMRAIDVVCRYGGEEFVVVMPGSDDIAALQAAERLRIAVAAEPFALGQNQRSIDITISAGVAQIRAGEDNEAALKRADHALYRAKQDGRNRVVMDEQSIAKTASGQ